MNIKDIVEYAVQLNRDLKSKKVKINEKYYPKACAYTEMIIARGTMIMDATQRMNRFMEDINDGMKRLQTYGLELPKESRERNNDNPPKQ